MKICFGVIKWSVEHNTYIWLPILQASLSLAPYLWDKRAIFCIGPVQNLSGPSDTVPFPFPVEHKQDMQIRFVMMSNIWCDVLNFNKKVLRERKRHTARRVASARSVALSSPPGFTDSSDPSDAGSKYSYVTTIKELQQALNLRIITHKNSNGCVTDYLYDPFHTNKPYIHVCIEHKIQTLHSPNLQSYGKKCAVIKMNCLLLRKVNGTLWCCARSSLSSCSKSFDSDARSNAFNVALNFRPFSLNSNSLTFCPLAFTLALM